MPWFWELSTERQIGMTVGPIPVSKVREKAETVGFDRANALAFEIVMRILDSRYMEWVRDDIEKKQMRSNGGQPNTGWSEGWAKKG